MKRTRITERQSIEIRAEATNVTNHQAFSVGDQMINSTTFGRVTETSSSPRRIQFGLYYAKSGSWNSVDRAKSLKEIRISTASQFTIGEAMGM